MKRHILILSFILFSTSLYGQSRAGYESIITFLPPGYQITALNGFGFENNNLTTISNITNSNPSLITGIKPFSFGISKQFNSDIKDAYIADIGYKYIENLLPQSAGIVIPLEDFRFGLGVSQIFNAQLDLGTIPITTTEQPDGTGEYLNYVHKTTLFTSSLLAAYPFQKVFTDNDQLSIGGQFNLHFINHKNYLNQTGHESDFQDVSWNAGINYKFSSSYPLTQLGLFFEKGFRFQNSVTFKENNVYPDPVIDSLRRPPTYYQIPNNYKITGFIPDKLTIGLLYQPNEQLILSGNIANIFWNTYQESVHDQIELSSNAVYKWNDLITTSAGIYLTNKDYFGETPIYFDMDNYNAAFLSLGTILNLGNINIETTVADSHLFSNEWRKQTLFKLALDYSL
jgi:hypothetical protein